ncbi:hypothetical protein FHX06_007154 [Rhizobium sp. BK512]|nr:hypothetical protein [Rhizobium sp. BK512]
METTKLIQSANAICDTDNLVRLNRLRRLFPDARRRIALIRVLQITLYEE